MFRLFVALAFVCLTSVCPVLDHGCCAHDIALTDSGCQHDAKLTSESGHRHVHPQNSLSCPGQRGSSPDHSGPDAPCTHPHACPCDGAVVPSCVQFDVAAKASKGLSEGGLTVVLRDPSCRCDSWALSGAACAAHRLHAQLGRFLI
jgi:hypothetical protein